MVVVAALGWCAACSNTGLAGRVTTTTAAEKDPTTAPTTAPSTSPPGSPGSPGSGGSGGAGGSGADQPDGFLIFQNLETPSTLWSIHADGTAKKQLPAVNGHTLSAPLLSPDGSQLAFEATPIVAAPGPSPPPQPKLWVSRSDGTDAHPLAADATADTCAAWSPDGTRLLSSTLDPTTGKTVSRLFTVPPPPPRPPSSPLSPNPPDPSNPSGGPSTSTPNTTTTTSTTTEPPTTAATPPVSPVPPVPATPVPIDAVGMVCPVFLDANTLAYPSASSPAPPPTTTPPSTTPAPTTPAPTGPSAPVPPSSTTPEPPSTPAKIDTIISVHLDGSPGETITTIPGCTVTDVRAAPAGGVVAFSASCDDATASGLYLVGPDKQPSIVVPGSSGAFAWSPEAAWLAYSRTDPTNPLATTEVLISHSNGSGPRRLIGPANQAPTWGPLPSGGASDRRV